jgi:hypothetical protein
MDQTNFRVQCILWADEEYPAGKETFCYTEPEVISF